MITSNKITVIIDNDTKFINKESGQYNVLLDYIKNGEWDKVKETLCVSTDIKNKSNNRFEIQGNFILIDGEVVPGLISQRILEFREKGIPFEPIINFWTNLRYNPDFNARRDLFKFLEHNGHAITDDGHFIAYKSVNREFKDHRTNTFDNSVGTTVKEDRSKMDTNPQNTCSVGLHVANFEYAKDFHTNSIMLMVKVNPKNVVSVPVDYNGMKMRCCEYEVISVCEKPLTEIYYEDEKEYADEREYEDYDDDEDYDDNDDNDLIDHTDGALDDIDFEDGKIKNVSDTRLNYRHQERDEFGRFKRKI